MESLIFDIDGTLWDSRQLVAEGYNLQLQEEGLTQFFVDAETLKPLFGKVMTEIAGKLFPTLSRQQALALMERCMDRENRYLQENSCQVGYPGVAQAMEALAKKHRLFIVSNSQQGYPELCIEKLGIAPWISGHLCFGDTNAPKGVTIRQLMERHGITSAVYVGDTQGDYEASLEAGIPFVWASYGFGTPEGYDYAIDSLQELVRLSEEGIL